jgi:hypothetical protein
MGQAPIYSVQYRFRQTAEERLRGGLCKLEMLHGIDHSETLRTLSELGQRPASLQFANA